MGRPFSKLSSNDKSQTFLTDTHSVACYPLKEIPGSLGKMKPTILIVEDHGGMPGLILDLLSEAFPKGNFLEAKNGEEAVDLARGRSLDIVLMDLGLPKMNGIEATRRIKVAVPESHVVIVTNHEGADFQRAATIAGASAYICKRQMETELIAVLTKLFPG